MQRIKLELGKYSTASETAEHVNYLADPLPTFHHKWSRRERTYQRVELLLPIDVWFRGATLPSMDVPLIGFGGTRSPNVETFCFVAKVARLLALQGCYIVSGGVPGVDLAAHLGAIEANSGGTLAVMANPVELGLKGHEWSNSLVEQAICLRGGFMSEYKTVEPFDSDQHRERLLQRDRIISGISDVFVAFECSNKSATVDTARRALAQGKCVAAVSPALVTVRRGTQVLSRDPLVATFSEREGAEVLAANVSSLLKSRSRFSA